MSPSYARRRLLAGIPVVALVLAGCAPEFNWREVRYPEHKFVAMFPAKPDTLTRRIDLDGQPVEMTMAGTAAGGAQFAVGVVRLADAGRADKALAAMRAQMVRNLVGRETSVDARPVMVVDANGQRVATAVATLVVADGTLGGAPGRLVAGFVGHGDRVVQFVVLAPVDGFAQDEARTFVDGFRLLQ